MSNRDRTPGNDDDIVWAPYISVEDEPNRVLGFAAGLMVVAFERWVHRRVESVQFVGQSRVRRHISVDFRLPRAEFNGGEPLAAALHLVPLTFLQKVPLTSFDLRDESGRALPLLTRHENAWVSWSILAAAAELVLGRRPSEAVIAVLIDITMSNEEEALAAVESLNEVDVDGQTLSGSDFFRDLANDFARYFLLLVPVTPDPGARRILKFSYDEPFPWDSIWQARRGIAARLNWRDTQFIFELPAVGYGGSFHFELKPPAGLEISRAEISAESLDGSKYTEVTSGPTTAGHVYLSDVPSGSFGLAKVWLRPERRGLLRSSLFITLATAALLAAGNIFQSELRELRTGGSGGSLLLAVPGAIAAFIARPGEHQFVSRILLWVRGGVILSGVSSYLAALILAIDLDNRSFAWAWAVLGALAWLAAIAVTGTYLRLLTRYSQFWARIRRS